MKHVKKYQFYDFVIVPSHFCMLFKLPSKLPLKIFLQRINKINEQYLIIDKYPITEIFLARNMLAYIYNTYLLYKDSHDKIVITIKNSILNYNGYDVFSGEKLSDVVDIY
jgi:hypothetical protein